MPELPEIESLSRKLNSKIEGKTVRSLSFSGKKLRYPTPQKKIVKILDKVTVLKVSRVGKQLVISTRRGEVVFHLGMTGDFSVDKKLHTHLEVRFDKFSIYFSDPRRFGYILTSLDQDVFEKPAAPDALNGKHIANHLYEISRKSKSSIKSLLLNQKKIVGIGNIYSLEILFAAGINPWTTSSKLSLDEYELLEEKIQEVLQAAISTAMKDKRFIAYFDINFEVYGKEGQDCSICGNAIVRKKQNGRSTFYCPSCQR